MIAAFLLAFVAQDFGGLPVLIDGPSAGGPATPDTVTSASLTIWYRPEDLPGAGTLTTWEDNSGNDKDATQGTADRRPTVVENHIGVFSAVLFDGTNDVLVIDNSSANAHHCFLAYDYVSTPGASIVGRFSSDSVGGNKKWENVFVTLDTGAPEMESICHTGAGNCWVSGTTDADAAVHTVNLRYESNNNFILRLDGVEEINETDGNETNNNIDALGCAKTDLTRCSNIYIMEAFCYDGALSGADLADMESYLSGRFTP